MTDSNASTSGTLQDSEKNTGPEWVCKATNKSTPLDLQKNKETFHESKASFDEPTQSGLQVPPSRGIPQQAPCGDSPEQIP